MNILPEKLTVDLDRESMLQTPALSKHESLGCAPQYPSHKFVNRSLSAVAAFSKWLQALALIAAGQAHMLDTCTSRARG